MSMNAAVSATPKKEPSLSEFINDNCEKVKMARGLALQIASNLLPSLPCDSGKTADATCAIEKAFEESAVLQELIATLDYIIARL